jgi:SAM-dependent methyltransferase
MNSTLNPICPLCNNPSEAFFQEKFYICLTCSGIFRPKHLLLDYASEKKRYETHNNDVNDIRYQTFVSPITKAILKEFSTEQVGLDFGAGTGPVISKILADNGYNIKQYDPFFHNFPELLKNNYDYIACCEVIEHFYDPLKEFKLLKNLLKNNGALFCMTAIYDNSMDFAKWFYKDDPTHVFIYQKETLLWIQTNVCFSKVIIENKLIKFTLSP